MTHRPALRCGAPCPGSPSCSCSRTDPRRPSPRTRAPARLPAERVTLNLRDASVPTALRLLAQQYKVNMLVTEDVRGQVTLDFFRVPGARRLQAIIDAGNLRCVVAATSCASAR